MPPPPAADSTPHAVSRLLRRGALVAGVAAVLLGLLMDFLVEGDPGLGTRQLLLVAAGLGLAVAALLPRRTLQHLALLGVSVVLALALGEVGLRLLFDADFVTPYRLHPRYLHVLKPDITRHFRRKPVNGGQRITFHTNRDGFRGEALRPRAEQTRVVVYGDSFIQAEYSDLADTFSEQLEDRLAAATQRDVEVINAGVTAYGPDQVCRRLEDEIEPLDPDLVIVAVFADNDFGDLLRNKIFSLASDGGLEERDPVLSHYLEETWRQADQGLYLEKLLARIGDTLSGRGRELRGTPESRMATWLYDSRLEYESYVVEGDLEVVDILADFYDADISLEPESDSAVYKLRLMEQVLARIAETARRHRRPLLLLVIPSPVDVVEDYDYGRVDRARYPAYRPTTLSDAVAAMADRLGLPVVNLFGPFHEQGAAALYFRGGDNHWNDAGQALAAELVAEAVVSRSLLR